MCEKDRFRINFRDKFEIPLPLTGALDQAGSEWLSRWPCFAASLGSPVASGIVRPGGRRFSRFSSLVKAVEAFGI